MEQAVVVSAGREPSPPCRSPLPEGEGERSRGEGESTGPSAGLGVTRQDTIPSRFHRVGAVLAAPACRHEDAGQHAPYQGRVVTIEG